MKWFTVAMSFAFMFGCGFFLGGIFVLPFVSPGIVRQISIFEGAYWVHNWAGAIVGVAFGYLSARATLRHYDQKAHDE